MGVGSGLYVSPCIMFSKHLLYVTGGSWCSKWDLYLLKISYIFCSLLNSCGHCFIRYSQLWLKQHRYYSCFGGVGAHSQEPSRILCLKTNNWTQTQQQQRPGSLLRKTHLKQKKRDGVKKSFSHRNRLVAPRTVTCTWHLQRWAFCCVLCHMCTQLSVTHVPSMC